MRRLTYLLAEFTDAASTGTPPQISTGGRATAGRAVVERVRRAHLVGARLVRILAAVEAQYANKVYVNDRNTDYAPSYAVANLRAGWTQRSAPWTFTEFARLNNVAAHNYSGTVIVGDTNGRYFEPSPERNFLVGLTANVVSDGSQRYTRTAIVLHWLIAAIVMAQIALGWWMQEIPKDPAGPRVNAYNLHKSIGLTVMALMLVRLAWRATHAPPRQFADARMADACRELGTMDCSMPACSYSHSPAMSGRR